VIVKTLVAGAGPCGLGAAERLTELGDSEWVLVDASIEPGGHARSIRDDNGFTWDIGGHVQYATSAAYSALLRRLFPHGMNELRRNSSAYRHGRFIPYPYQLNIAALPEPERSAALRDLVEAAEIFPVVRHDPGVASLGPYLRAKYGTTIYETFMLPYNLKAWSIHPDHMGTYWVRDFLADVDVAEAERNVATGQLTTNWGYNANFHYPRSGGCGEIWRRLAVELHGTGRLALGTRIVALDPVSRLAVLDQGDTIRYEHLVSTIPLPALCHLSGDPELVQLAAQLHASQLLVIGIGLDAPLPALLQGRSWVYFADPDCPFHRLSVLSNYADANVAVPGKQYSLLCEVSAPPGQMMNQPLATERTLAWLEQHGFITRSRIASIWGFHTTVGYPTPTLGRNDTLRAIQARLSSWGIYSRGRLGSWVYETSNQDSTYQQGREVIEFLLSGHAERTSVFV
jgi:protoporphyrinogen oxidase